MTLNQKKSKIGILGCGAIGSRIAKSATTELKTYCTLNGLFDIDKTKTKKKILNLELIKSIMLHLHN